MESFSQVPDKRILLVGPLGVCGISTVNFHLINILTDAKGVQPAALDTVPYRSGNKVLGYLKLYICFVFGILRTQPELVCLQISQTGYLHQSVMLLFAKLLGKKTIAYFHAKPVISESVTKLALRIVLFSRWYTDDLIVLSDRTREDLIAHGWKNPIHVIPNFIDESVYEGDPIPWQERRYILFIGRMIRDKGIFDIIEMAKALGNENFVLVGPFESKSAEKHFLVMLDGICNIKWLGCAYGNEKVDLIKHAKWIQNL